MAPAAGIGFDKLSLTEFQRSGALRGSILNVFGGFPGSSGGVPSIAQLIPSNVPNLFRGHLRGVRAASLVLNCRCLCHNRPPKP